MPVQNPNPNSKKKKRRNYDDGDEDDDVQEKQQIQFEFCKVCKLNHKQGRRHIYFPNHKKALSSFLSRFQSKLKNDVAFYLKNAIPLRPEHASLNRLWCVFCDSDVLESDSSFACGNAIAHLASAEHLKEVKSFLWKYGGGMDRVDSFRISESDFAKWEKKCKLLKTDAAGEGSHGSLIGPLNDIHNETKSECVNSFNKNKIDSLTFDVQFSNTVVPLQDHTNEISQISHSEISRVGSQIHHAGAVVGLGARTPDGLPGLYPHHFSYFIQGKNCRFNKMDIACLGPGFFANHLCNYSVPNDGPAYSCPNNGNVYPYKRIATGDRSSQGTSNGESSSQSIPNVTQISSSAQEDSGGNVHSGAVPPWFSATERIQLDSKLNQGLGDLVSSLGGPMKSKLNPKRVGAAWAERRKIELELEKRGELVRHDFDVDWLPNFGRVWQSGTRKESRKEFLGEKKAWHQVDSKIEEPSQLQPYISKRMRRDSSE